MDITLLNLHMFNDDDELVYIPNNTVLSVDVLNYSKKKGNKSGVEFEVGINHINSVSALEEYLIKSIQDFHPLIKPNSYNLKILEIKKDSVLMKFQYILKRLDVEKEKAIRRKIVRAVVEGINQYEPAHSGKEA